MSFERLIVGMYEFCRPLKPEEIPDDVSPEELRD